MREVRKIFMISLTLIAAGCASSGAFWTGVAQGLAATAPASPAAPASETSGFPAYPQLLLFGGDGHKTFLGCLNCSKFDSASVLNDYGTHGNKYNSESIFNQFGEFGSKYSSTSACNPYASDPPVIVDKEGNYYGRLSVNAISQSRNPTINAWIAGVCAGR